MTDELEEGPIEALEALILETPQFAPVPYWFASKQGWMSNVPSLFGTAHVKAGKPPTTLPDHGESFRFGEERLPVFIYTQALDFFRKVYEAYKTEATTYICRDAEGQYSLFIPQQYVSGASVNHKVGVDEMGDRLPVGTIHSHCMMGAFHSGTDDHDMGKMPGLHMTIGKVLADKPELAIAMAVGETQFDFSEFNVWDGEETEDANGYDTAPDHWIRFVHPNQQAPWTGGTVTRYSKFQSKIGRPGMAGFGSPGHMNYGDGYDVFGGGGAWDYSSNQAFSLSVVEADLAATAYDLAEEGYRLQYTITKDPAGAKTWLDDMKREPTQRMFSDDD